MMAMNSTGKRLSGWGFSQNRPACNSLPVMYSIAGKIDSLRAE